jgi:hypothetical protein
VLLARNSKAVGGAIPVAKGKGGKGRRKGKGKRKGKGGRSTEGKKETQKDMAASNVTNMNTFKCQ